MLQGHTMQLRADVGIKVNSSNAAGDGGSSGVDLQVGFFLFLPSLMKGAVCSITCKFMVKAAAAARLNKDVCIGPVTFGLHGGKGNNRGYREYFSFSSVSSWSEVEAKLKQDNMVHPDKCLHITASIIELA